MSTSTTSQSRAWLLRCREILKQPFFDMRKKKSRKKVSPPEKIPLWVENILDSIDSRSSRKINKSFSGGLSPIALGAIAGHILGVFEVELPAVKLVSKELKSKSKKINSLRPRYGKLKQSVKRKVREVQCIVAAQDVAAQLDFNDGLKTAYRNAAPEKNNLPGWHSDITKIHCMLLILANEMPYIKSVHHLHQVLRRLLPSQVVGDLKRIEKVCQRIGLTFRKKGRPKKEIQTRA